MKRILVLSALLVLPGCHEGGDGPRPVQTPSTIAESAWVDAAPVARISDAGDAGTTRTEGSPQDEPNVESNLQVAVISEAVGHPKSGEPLPGPCYDPERHAHIIERLPRESHAERLGIDLDGDGTQDTLIVGAARGFDSTMHLYVMRGTCGYYVGDLLGPFGTPKPLRASSRGLYDLRARNVMPAGCCSPIDEWTWRFDGKTYVSSSKRKVKQTCPLDPSPPTCSPNPP
ncbi:hypothetical protein LVJ94_14395 [Pendulispora rubella]|uniref:VCBS repeat-containing protein n=1 Tax=Pendulispora rubella TaxID=2741070 RepID=A0ABZ2LBX9_9BACT